jgi:hypothetical protein
MNKKITLSSILASALAVPFFASAQPSVTIGSISQLISKLETALWTVFGGIAVVMFVVAGILFLTAQGDPEKVKTARNAAIWGVAGIVVGIMAYSIIAIVSSMI